MTALRDLRAAKGETDTGEAVPQQAVLLTLSTIGLWVHIMMASGTPRIVATSCYVVLSAPLPTTECHFPLGHLVLRSERESHCLSPAQIKVISKLVVTTSVLSVVAVRPRCSPWAVGRVWRCEPGRQAHRKFLYMFNCLFIEYTVPQNSVSETPFIVLLLAFENTN